MLNIYQPDTIQHLLQPENNIHIEQTRKKSSEHGTHRRRKERATTHALCGPDNFYTTFRWARKAQVGVIDTRTFKTFKTTSIKTSRPPTKPITKKNEEMWSP